MQEQKIFYPVSQFYKDKFGEKVFKIPVAIAGRCPNLSAGTADKTCVFCDEWGSFAYPESQQLDLAAQIHAHRMKVRERYRNQKFFVYFQAYTTTYTQLKKVEEAFALALNEPDVVGLVLGTRPDCLSPALLDLLNKTAQNTFMALELGVQSFEDRQLFWMRRGHTSQQSLTALLRVRQNCPEINLGVHLIFGWPHETDDDIIRAAQLCNQSGVHNVKLHNLHVLKNTVLAEFYQKGEFQPIELDEYSRRVNLFLAHLSPEIAIHRLVATASRWDELIAPQWTRNKMQSYQAMIEGLRLSGLRQGQFYEAP